MLVKLILAVTRIWTNPLTRLGVWIQLLWCQGYRSSSSVDIPGSSHWKDTEPLMVMFMDCFFSIRTVCSWSLVHICKASRPIKMNNHFLDNQYFMCNYPDFIGDLYFILAIHWKQKASKCKIYFHGFLRSVKEQNAEYQGCTSPQLWYLILRSRQIGCQTNRPNV